MGQAHQCKCKAGFSGDGKTCLKIPAGSYVDGANNVHVCAKGYNSNVGAGTCVCDKGYIRDSKKNCVPCAFRTYKDTLSDTDKCKACE